ncbi:MAG: ArnT family glycosyltransferase, partial [Anaerolineae bacterium]
MMFGSASSPLASDAPRRRFAERWHPWLVAFVVALFLALGVVYNATVPIFEAPDEIQHFYYIKHLADGKGLPVQGSAESRQSWAQEGSQPPLYYLLGALIIRDLDTSDAGEIIWLNPQANIGTPRYPGNKNRIIHTAREDFPYEGTVQAVHVLRLYSLLWGCGTVVLTYFLAREVLRRRDLALLTAACAAFTPQFIFIHSAVSNDSLITFLSTLALWLMARMLRSERRARWAFPLGVTLGLAALAKLSGLALWGLAGLLLAYLLWRRRLSWQEAFLAGCLMAGLALLIAGPWFVRNLTLYGDLTGLRPMLEIVGRRTDRPTLADIWGEFRGLRISFWGLFGWFNILLPEAVYKLLDGVTLLAGLGLVLGVLRRSGAPLARRPAAALMGAWLTLMFLSLVRWTTITMGTQGRLLFPAMASFMILLVMGLAQLRPEERRFWELLPLPAGLLALSILSPFLAIQPAYARPPILTAGDVPAAAHIEPLTFGEGIRLIGMETSQTEVRPGESLHITLYWECLASIQEDYNIT